MNIKGLEERRNDLAEQMNTLLDTAKAEERAMTSEEINKFDELEAEINNIDKTIEREERRNTMENTEVKMDVTVEERDIQSFATYIRNSVQGLENRAETNLAKGDNGAVIPKTIVKKIMERVEEISPIYKLATKYHIAGTVNVPKEDNTSDTITVAYATEFTELESHSNKFATIELTGYLYGALTKISKSLLRNSDFDLTNWVVKKMAKKIAKFIEGELINGTSAKTAGIAGSYDATNMKVTLAKAGAVTADELIDLQELVPDEYQADAIWVMNRATRKAIRKLKDGQGNYLLEKDSTAKWGYRLMNNDVYCSDNMAVLGTAGKNVVMFGDFSGLAVKEGEKTEIQVLTERFATQHAVGVVAWGEIDAKVEDTQKIAVAVTGSAT
jgi:HK97 family phage major capsid protein